ncbi:SMP-30/gluconolactonase/LRE family protein [Marinimicrobium sp. ARAG 43.8]|uniref:SMP-30/gluconolactonase/LRE family protein n=1 Tax=Marinimicrobium sp. ARAG 43.8 TaxID=3418719 RepID=UPI003CF3D38D
MRQPQWLCSLPVHNTLGENVLWHPHRAELWWTDIHSRRLYRYALGSGAEPASGTLTHWQTPERLAAFGFVPGDGAQTLIAAFDRGFALYTPDTAECHWLAQPEAHLPNHRFNDGKVDRQGRFWAGTMVERGDPLVGEGAALYCWSGASGAQRHLQGLGVSNGLSWSPDSRTAYLSDSARGVYYAYDFDAPSGRFSNRRVLALAPEGVGHDGACVDTQGNLWSAHFGGGRVVCYAPDGEERLVLDVPVSQPTCVALGGPDLSWLCITTARENLSESQLAKEPEAGNVLIYQTGAKGLPVDFFRG